MLPRADHPRIGPRIGVRRLRLRRESAADTWPAACMLLMTAPITEPLRRSMETSSMRQCGGRRPTAWPEPGSRCVRSRAPKSRRVVPNCSFTNTLNQNHTDLHTDTGTEHQRDPRRSHPDRDPRNHKPATATAITEIAHLNRPTDARLGVHGDGGGPIGLEVHTHWHVHVKVEKLLNFYVNLL